jgi:uncharacterized protein YajQ (UPF0234 family)
MIKRGVSIKALQYGKQEPASGGMVRMVITLQQGISKEHAKEIVAMIKDTKLKVQTTIQGDQLRVTSRDIDDLQTVIKMFREKDLSFAIQFENYR